MMKVIIINGSGRTGKDQFVNFFKKNYQYKCVNWSTIDKVKKVAKRNFGWNGKKTDPARKFLSEIKRIWTEYNNGPFEHMLKKIESHYAKLDKTEKQGFVYFIHCREPHEIQKFVDVYNENCITLLINRDDRDVPNNDSDMNVTNYNYDFVIDNCGDKKILENKAINFIQELENKKTTF